MNLFSAFALVMFVASMVIPFISGERIEVISPFLTWMQLAGILSAVLAIHVHEATK